VGYCEVVVLRLLSNKSGLSPHQVQDALIVILSALISLEGGAITLDMDEVTRLATDEYEQDLLIALQFDAEGHTVTVRTVKQERMAEA